MRSDTRTLAPLGAALGCLGASALAAGCTAADPTAFNAFRDTTAIVVSHGAPDYGTVLVGYDTLVPDATTPGRLLRASRYAASGGPGTGYSIFGAFDEVVLDQRTTLGLRPAAGPDPRINGCAGSQSCGEGSSASIAAMPLWHQDATVTRYGCVVVPSGNVLVDSRGGQYHEQVHVRCESSSSSIEPLEVPVEGVDFGASAASLPPEHALGVALFGAPGDASRAGSLYRLDDYPRKGFSRVDLAGTPPGAALGSVLAATGLADGSVLVATTGFGRAGDPVVVALTIDASGQGTLRACLRGRGARFGSALAFGDLDGDGTPDLAVGAGVSQLVLVGAESQDLPIQLYDGSELVAASAAGCEDPPSSTLSPAHALECASDVSRGYLCATDPQRSYTAFGASLAIADVDVDGFQDLIVGAPYASTRVGGGGAVLVLGGTGHFDTIGSMEHSVLTYSSVTGNAHLGTVVATVQGADRREIVAGAPGQRSLVLFYCSDIPGDRVADFVGMPGVTHGCVVAPSPHGDVDASVQPMDAGVGAVDAAMDDAAMDDAAADDAGQDDAAIDDDAARGDDAGEVDAG